MPPFLFSCPTTGQTVQGFTAEEVLRRLRVAHLLGADKPIPSIRQLAKSLARVTTIRPAQLAIFSFHQSVMWIDVHKQKINQSSLVGAIFN